MKKSIIRILSITVATILALALFAGCAASVTPAPTAEPTAAPAAPTEAPAKPTEAPAAPTEAPTEEPTAEPEPDDNWEYVFESWNAEAPALQTLIEFVETVTDESSADFIPVERRVAVFDMDGTLYAELFPTYLEYYTFAWRVLADPDFTPDEEMIAVAEEIKAGGPTHTYASDMAIRHGTQAARAYAGMTLTEFNAWINAILIREADGFTGMTYGEAYYQPMIEVIEYLRDNDFDVYVVSGSDRYLCRALFEGIIDIPSENFIGMDVNLLATGQGEKAGVDYTYQPSDTLVRGDQLMIKNLKTNKVTAIAREIGKQPVLSFGNSSGDSAMHLYTMSNNEYKSAAFMLIADDGERDYGHPEKGEALRAQWEELGFNVISMRDDFATIYGEGVQKTGEFRWTEELQR